MKNSNVNEFYKKINSALTDKTFLKKSNITNKFINKILERRFWISDIEVFLKKEKFNSYDILDLCEKSLVIMSEKIPKEGWLKYTYNFLIKNIYPHRQDIVFSENISEGVYLYLEVLKTCIKYEKENRGFDPFLDFDFATKKEMQDSPYKKVYNGFLEKMEKENIYELMWIGKDVMPFDLLAHVAGVHHIAMHICRQLLEANLPIDIGLVSGAAAGHDIGKYGCQDFEMQRLPYLHYYYTDIWFRNRNLQEIGHIAANHSTWDLELDNLPIESLILIYADFRVKNDGYIDGKEHMKIYSLEESFDVILEKLDNVDQAKEDRYRHVYSRLVDFESYMISLGVNVDLQTNILSEVSPKELSLLTLEETVAEFKNISMEHNIYLMHKLSREASFNEILETARSSRDWKNSRTYLNIFSEYFSYMTQKQKQMCMRFLYECMVNREGDIRRQSAELLGKIIANYDIEYGKELPENGTIILDSTNSSEVWKRYLEMIILPDYKMINQHRRWLGYGLKRTTATLLTFCHNEKRKTYINDLVYYYEKENWNSDIVFLLLDAMGAIPNEELDDEQRLCLLRFMEQNFKSVYLGIQARVLLNFKDMADYFKHLPETKAVVERLIKEMIVKGNGSLEYLLFKVGDIYDMKEKLRGISYDRLYEDTQIISDIFLENLKSATPWVIKLVNIELLYERICLKKPIPKLHVAAHLSNILKVSEQVGVRHFAGKTLVNMAQYLTWDERNEIAIELRKGLEMGEIQFTKYIPKYLGEFAMYLHPKELDELIMDLVEAQNNAKDMVASVILDTFGVMLKHYKDYDSRFPEYIAVYEKRRKKMLGSILNGFASHQHNVNREAFWVVGHEIFGSPEFSLELKKIFFGFISKKMVTIATEKDKSGLAFFNDTIGWRGVYNFISEYMFTYEKFVFDIPKKIAFFPGSYDPFTLGHKEIALAIRNMGFVVYLALDEFSWSKKTQPNKIRRKIVNMSVASEENIYLFPEDIPINIGNPEDLGKLRSLFPDCEVYMVAGSDVVENASSYTLEVVENSIQTFPHILFLRDKESEIGNHRKTTYECIKNEVIELKLPKQFEDISSTRIRENIDNNRDITNLIDTMAQNYIYENSLYLREPQYKRLLKSKNIEVMVYSYYSEGVQAIKNGNLKAEILENILESYKGNMTSVVIWEDIKLKKIAGIMLYKLVSTTDLYKEFGDVKLAEYVRKNTSGKIVLIEKYYINNDNKIDEINQILLTETIGQTLKEDYTYCIFSMKKDKIPRNMIGVLERQGFLPLEKVENREIYVVDMKSPITLFHNIQTVVKEPFNENENVLKELKKAHYRLQIALTKLFKGMLVISFDVGIMYNRLITLITKANRVSKEATVPRKLGDKMCVPYGKIMRGAVIPNTVTKALHTEKAFDSEINTFTIKEFPQYLPLNQQVRTIKSFRRSVILVDDLLHQGFRINNLEPILNQENLDIERVVVGILSGLGRDLMEIQGREVESAYFVPSLKYWFVETTMYPFIGGDGIAERQAEEKNMLPSVNLILPYVMPKFNGEVDEEDIYNLSKVCLQNAKNIIKVLEKEYQHTFERSLTLDRLNEVIIAPRIPDQGSCLQYDYSISPSVYIDSDLERLARLNRYKF